MDPEQTALPTGDTAAAGEQSTTDAAAAQPTEQAGDQHEATGEQAEGAEQGAEAEGDKPAKKERSEAERERDRLRRRIDNKTRRMAQLEAELAQYRGSQQRPQQQSSAEDGETVTLTRAEIEQLIAERAERAAPAIAAQRAEAERQQGVAKSLLKDWGPEKFREITDDLDEVLGGLKGKNSFFSPAAAAILESDDPKGVIEYLTDPDNQEAARRIASAPDYRVGRELARIEDKLREQKAKAKPAKSNAARPIEAVKGGGVPTGMPDPSNTKAYIAWANAQERAAR